MSSVATSPEFFLGGGSSGGSAGLSGLGELELDYENLLSGATDIVAGTGAKTIIITSGAITTASSVAAGTESQSEIASNYTILEEIAQFCNSHSIEVEVEANLTYAPTWPSGSSEGHNELVDQWANVAAGVGLPISSVEDVEENATVQPPSTFATCATIEANAVKTLIEDYAGSSYHMTAANLAVGDMEGAPPTTTYLTQWWNAYDASATALGVPEFSYTTADTSWFAPWIESVPSWQGFLEAISKAASSENMALNVLVQGSEADLSASQFVGQAEQNATDLAMLAATGSIDVTSLSVLSWSALPVGVDMISSPTSSSNEVAEIEATYPLYAAGSITATGILSVAAPSQLVVSVGTTESFVPLAVSWDATDMARGSRLGVVIIDQSGSLTARKCGSGTVSNPASNILVLTGNSADLSAELNSVTLREAAAGSDTIDVESYGSTGPESNNEISVFAVAPGQSTRSVHSTASSQGWVSSSAILNSGTVVTGGSILSSETMYWNTTGTLSSGQSAFINTVSIHEPLAEYGVENASSIALGTKAGAIVDIFDSTLDSSPYRAGGYANNQGVNNIDFAPLKGWLGSAFDPASAVVPLVVQSTTNIFNPITGGLEISVSSLAPDPIVVVDDSGPHPDTFATAFTNGGTQVTAFPTGNDSAWQPGWSNQFSSVTSTYDDAGVLVERFFRGGTSDSLFSIDDVFDPNTGGLEEEFQSTTPPPVAPGTTAYALTNTQYQPDFGTGPVYITEFNTGENPNWDYLDWGGIILSDTEVGTDYFIMENFAGFAVDFPSSYSGGLNAYPYEFVNGHALDLMYLPGRINVDLNALGTVTISSETLSSGLSGLSEIDAAGATGTVAITGLTTGGCTLIGGDNISNITGFGGDMLVTGSGRTTVNTGAGGSSILISSSTSSVSVVGDNNTLTTSGGTIAVSGSGNTLDVSGNTSIVLNGSDDTIDQLSTGATITLGQYMAELTITGEIGSYPTILDAAGKTVSLSDAVTNADGSLQIDITPPAIPAVTVPPATAEATVGQPTVTAVTISPATGDFGVGQVVTLTLSVSTQVTVLGGVPTLALNDGGTAYYSGGSGTNLLTFNYVVALGQNTPDLSVVGVTLNHATIAAGSSPIALNLAGASLGSSGALQIDTTPLSVSPAPGQVMCHATASQYVVADDGGSLYLADEASAGDGTQTLPDVTQIVFTDCVGVFDPSGTAENVARLYLAALGRAPDVAGLESWTAAIDNSNVPLSAVANNFVTSPEFIHDYGSLSDAAFVDCMYQNVLGRPADVGGAQGWVDLLGSGVGRGQILLDFAESQEFKADSLGIAGDVDDAEIYRLYTAALGRVPDASGQQSWSSALADGTSLTQIAQDFISSAEFAADYGALAPSAFVSKLYLNVLHRPADPPGLQSWTNALVQGRSEASVLIGFSDSLENRYLTASATHSNWVSIPGG